MTGSAINVANRIGSNDVNVFMAGSCQKSVASGKCDRTLFRDGFGISLVLQTLSESRREQGYLVERALAPKKRCLGPWENLNKAVAGGCHYPTGQATALQSGRAAKEVCTAITRRYSREKRTQVRF